MELKTSFSIPVVSRDQACKESPDYFQLNTVLTYASLLWIEEIKQAFCLGHQNVLLLCGSPI